jgi:hypothetical protein
MSFNYVSFIQSQDMEQVLNLSRHTLNQYNQSPIEILNSCLKRQLKSNDIYTLKDYSLLYYTNQYTLKLNLGKGKKALVYKIGEMINSYKQAKKQDTSKQ